ncbi:MAG: endonuclease/exonuclease/phosphatase family protein [Myxococcota bacterium]|nr:endonuclease/exonuclease/phosphatase family protein [Myxococcota bacterium]
MTRPNRVLRRWGAAVAALGGAAAAVFGVRFLSFEPEPVMALKPSGEQGRMLEPGEVFTVLNWNLQYAGSRKHNFFYDGGPAVHVPPDDVVKTIQQIQAVLEAVDADLVLLQEVDRASWRTSNLDQLEVLRDSARWPVWVSTPYHRSGYVPHPSGNHLGKVDMHLAVLSRFALRSVVRIDLPRLDESWVRQVFNLKRALLALEVPVVGEAPLRLGNTHLSAFSQGDGTLGRQVGVLRDWMARSERVLLAGDFNALPPGDDRTRLPDDGHHYADETEPLEALAASFSEVSGSSILSSDWYTYLPFGADAPDRKIDHIFYGKEIEVLEARVLSEYSDISDHLPIWVKARVRTP